MRAPSLRASILLFTAACAGHVKPAEPSWRPAHLATNQAERSVFLIMIDGTNYRVIHDLYERGELPALRGLVESRNGRFLRTVTTFPSATAPSLPELLVGRYSDRTQPDFLRHVQEFNREAGVISRYAFMPEAWNTSDTDLFDLVKATGKVGDSYFEGEFEGAGRNVFEPAHFRMEQATGFAHVPIHNYDKIMMDRVIDDLRQGPTPPDLVFIGLGVVDVAGHFRGPDSEEYASFLRSDDQDIGRLLDHLRSRSHPSGGTLFDHSDFYIFGDHGMAPTEVRITIGDDLSRLGLTTSDGSDVPALVETAMDPNWSDRNDAIALAIGSNVADVHVRARRPDGSRDPWPVHPALADLRALPLSKGPGTLDLVHYLAGRPGVARVLVSEGPGRVLVEATGGSSARISQDPTGARRFAYEVLRTDSGGADPLGYLQDPGAAALVTPPGEMAPRFHDDAAWMQATASTAFPMAPTLVPKAFTPSATTPDIVLDAQPLYSFLPWMLGDHASLDAESITSFLVAVGPATDRFPSAGVSTVRLIDVNADVRKALDLPIDPDLDSKGLAFGPAVLAGEE